LEERFSKDVNNKVVKDMSILDKTNFTKGSQSSTIKEYKIERAKMLHEY